MAHFFTDNADPVVDTTANMRNLDPCGDIVSYPAAVDANEANEANVASISVPTWSTRKGSVSSGPGVSRQLY